MINIRTCSARTKAKDGAAGHKPVSLSSDDDAFDGDSDEEEVAVQLAAQRRQALAESLSAAEPKPPRAQCPALLLA